MIGFGYETRDSTVPVNFTSAVTLPGSNGNLIDVDNTYSVHRGYTLTLPPLLNNFVTTPLPLGLGSATLPNLPALVQPAPKPKITDVIAIGGTALQLRFRHEDTPNVTHDGVSLTGGLKYDYRGSARSDLASFKTAIGTIGLGLGTSSPAGTAFNACAGGLLGGAGACSNEVPTDTTENASLKFTSSEPTKFDLFQTIIGDGITCPTGLTAVGLDAHLTGSQFSFGQRKASATAGSGKIYIDTADTPVEGCVAVGTVASNGLFGSVPTGFKANKRNVTYRQTTTFGFPTGFAPDSKSGTITCPPGTALTTPSTIAIAYSLTETVCAFPPVNTAPPTISGNAYVGSTLTANNGTWTPGAPNAPTFTYQWQRCDGAGNSCANIAGATASTYTIPIPSSGPPSGSPDIGKTFRVVVTGTNLDGAASVTSAQSSVTTLPPAPVNTVAPVIAPVPVAGGVGSGRVLHTTNGTFTNGVQSYAYQWKQCATVSEPNPASCPDALGAGATTPDYTITQGDETKALFAIVTATNIGGSASKASNGLRVPGKPTNTVAPSIKNGSVPAAGEDILTGDKLNAVNGTWTDAVTFSYQWLRCDNAGTNCVAIVGATGPQYTVTNDDIGSTIGLTVTAKNPNLLGGDGEGTADAAPTGLVSLNDQILRTGVAVPDGTVNTTAASGANTAYVGGSFDTVGKATGGSAAIGLAAVSTPAGTPTSLASAATGGPVNAVVSDGASGYFLGGSFTTVLGVPCPSLAHVKADGTLDAAYCASGIVGTVRALDRVGGASKFLVVGGAFTVAGHANLAFFDTLSAAPAAVFATGADPDGPVNAVAQDGGNRVFIGGDFNNVDGTPAGHIARYQITGSGVTATIARFAWPVAVCTTSAPGVCDADPSTSTVKSLSYTSLGGVFVGGKFTAAIGHNNVVAARGNAAAFSIGTVNVFGFGFQLTNGELRGWNPNANGQVNVVSAPPSTSSLGPFSVYIGGTFTTVGAANLAIPRLAQFGVTSSGGTSGNTGGRHDAAGSTNFVPAPDGPVTTIANGPGTGTSARIYVGGSFGTIYGQPRHRLAVINGVSTNSTTAPTLNAADFNAGNTVNSLARDGANLFIGGAFQVVGGVTRNNAAEIGLGGIGPWDPSTNGPVNAITPSGANVWVGGAFSNAGGAARGNLAATSPATGAATGSDPAVDGPVRALAPAALDGAYVGGAFANAGGQPRANIAALDATGAATAFNPGTDGPVNVIAPGGSGVYVGGLFGTVGGQPRANIAEVDAGGSTAAFNPGTDGAVKALAVTAGNVYLGGTFTTADSAPRNNAAAVDQTTGTATSWDPDANGSVNALLAVGPTVFAGGAFTTISGQSRGHGAGIDAGDSTSLTSFDPIVDGDVNSLTRTTGTSLVVGGTFVTAQNLLTPALAFFGGT